VLFLHTRFLGHLNQEKKNLAKTLQELRPAVSSNTWGGPQCQLPSSERDVSPSTCSWINIPINQLDLRDKFTVYVKFRLIRCFHISVTHLSFPIGLGLGLNFPDKNVSNKICWFRKISYLAKSPQWVSTPQHQKSCLPCPGPSASQCSSALERIPHL